MLDQSTGGYAQIVARKILQEILPYLNLYPTEEVTDEELNNIGITREQAEIGRQIDSGEPETDENGNIIEPESETDENGNVIPKENGVAENPNMAAPPQENGKNSESTGIDAGITNEELGLE